MDPVTIVVVGAGLAFAGNYALKSMDDGIATICFQPSAMVRVCEDVPKSELDQRIAEAIQRTGVQQRLASGQVVE